jgi:PPOX class probable F420-dependent enzyme
MACELPPSAVELIESGAHAHLVTLNPDGSPQASVVWSAVENGEICIPSFAEWRKIKNIRRDPRVVVTYESSEHDPRSGLRHYLVVRGRARVDAGGAHPLMSRLSPRYLPVGREPPGRERSPSGFVTRITPQRLGGNGPWTQGR